MEDNDRARFVSTLVHAKNGRWYRTDRRFTRPQIAEFLSVPEEEVDRLMGLWDKLHKPMSEVECAKATRAFLKKHKRWPKRSDFKRRDGMPSKHHLEWHLGGWNGNFDTGYSVLQELVIDRYKLTIPEILTIPNLTLRRDAIESIGGLAVVTRMGELIQEDDYGRLWHLPGDTPKAPMVVVEVINATQNPDGSYDHYFLRVPPDTTTARAAVAWTFEVEPSELEYAAQS